MTTYTNYTEKIQAFKSEIKLIAGYIKSHKTGTQAKYVADNNYTPRGRFSGKLYQRHIARHMNIAYSLVRGRTMKQIESKVREHNEPDMKFVNKLTHEFMNPETYDPNDYNTFYDKPEVKMYVLVRKDLEPRHRMVQGGHAVAQYLLDHNEEEWKNGTMVYLAVDNEAQLNTCKSNLKALNKKYSSFSEPDWGETPTLTAISCVDTGDIFSELRLLNTYPMKEKSFISNLYESCKKFLDLDMA